MLAMVESTRVRTEAFLMSRAERTEAFLVSTLLRISVREAWGGVRVLWGGVRMMPAGVSKRYRLVLRLEKG
jgi:hypothetical protein